MINLLILIDTFNPLARFIALKGLKTRNTRRILTVEILSELMWKKNIEGFQKNCSLLNSLVKN